MSLVTTAELQTFMGTALVAAQAQAALDIAEQQVAIVLGMVESDGLGLARRTGVVKTFYVLIDGASALEVPTGPLESISACLVDGAAQTIGANGIQIRTPWSIRWDPAGTGSFARDARITLTANIGYIAGAPGAGEVQIPPAVKNAVLLQASGVYTNLGSIAAGRVVNSEKIGDYAISYATTATQTAVAPILPSLLTGIRRPPFVGA